jgi:hypothetical protein
MSMITRKARNDKASGRDGRRHSDPNPPKSNNHSYALLHRPRQVGAAQGKREPNDFAITIL